MRYLAMQILGNFNIRVAYFITTVLSLPVVLHHSSIQFINNVQEN